MLLLSPISGGRGRDFFAVEELTPLPNSRMVRDRAAREVDFWNRTIPPVVDNLDEARPMKHQYSPEGKSFPQGLEPSSGGRSSYRGGF
jgi:hypothetical protein